MESWTDINARYVLPARRHLLGGRVAQGEELLRQGLEQTGDGWIAYQLAEVILLRWPDDAARIEEACALYGRAVEGVRGEGHKQLAAAALAKAKAMLALAPRREARPKTLLPSAEAPAPVRRVVRVEEPVEEEEPPPPDPLVEKLKSIFGFESFRPGQREVIEALLKGRQALAVMPTGSGKSLLYEFPSQVLDGVTVVVSPLIALMKDQEARLHANGITNGAYVNSSLPPEEVRARLAAFREGKTRLLYVAPERFADERLLEGMKVALFAIDEAHCISEWGHSFRPDYLRLREVIQRTAPGTVLAVTATATPRVRAEIIDKLGMAAPFVHVGSFDRRNLVWSVIETKDKAAALRGVLAERPGSAIVYTSRRADAETVASMLKTAGVRAAHYHAGMDTDERSRVQEDWRADRITVVVATIAFGMGIDKPDVRAVVHWQMPASLEAYYQEAGRAGRDGQPAHCVLLFDAEDKGFHRWAIDQTYPDRAIVTGVYEGVGEGLTREALKDLHSESRVSAALAELERQGFIRATASGEYEKSADAPQANRIDVSEIDRRRRQAEERIRGIERYAEARGCRRMEMLGYFGERLPQGWQCAGCDRCRAAREGAGQDGGPLKQAVAMGVRELEGRRFSITEMARAILFLAPPHVIRALRGKTEAEVRDLINALLRDGEIQLDPRGSFVRSRR